MVTRILPICFLLSLTPISLFAEEPKQEPTFDWTFVDLEYMDLDIDNDFNIQTDSDSNYEFEGQYALGEHLLLYGAYQVINADFIFRSGSFTTTIEHKRTDTFFGAGARFALGKKIGVFVRGGYLFSKLTQGPSSFSQSRGDDGYFLSAGIRGRVHNRVELFATGNHQFDVDYLFFAPNQSMTDYQFGARFDVSKHFQVGVAYRDGEFSGDGLDYDGFGISGRYNFK